DGGEWGCALRPGLDDSEPDQLRPTARRAAVPVARAGAGGGRAGAAGADGIGGDRLPRRRAREKAQPELQGRADPRPGGRPAVHPGGRHRPRAARHHPRGPGAVAAPARHRPRRPGAVPAHPRVQLPAGPLPRQGRHRRAAVRLSAAPARGRVRHRGSAGEHVRLELRDLGCGAVLVGRPAVRLAGAHSAADASRGLGAHGGRRRDATVAVM
ncbi:MAG: CDP-diacylglycerol--glycerol-3-phosphate 3-phosphatidyltransferase, partial [uncultured Nocardioidaceae bacterium]